MYLAYFDETGDDGYPKYSSELFVLTSIYMHFQNWKSNYQTIYDFRKQLKKDFNFPIKLEFHCRPFLTEKFPYRTYHFSNEDKLKILHLFFTLISILDLKIINVVINKTKIKSRDYNVLENALKYNIQRIENDLGKMDPTHKFIIITDEGRTAKMTRVTRKIQKFNFIPSKYDPEPYRAEIKTLIEDPLPKPSEESYFIQIADIISYCVFLYSLNQFTKKRWANRVKQVINYKEVYGFLEIIKDRLNLAASSDQEFGIVHYPK